MAFTPSATWEFNTLGVYDPAGPGKLASVLSWLEREGWNVPGDIIEAGCFRGRTLLAFALFLRERGIDKKVYGYDTFSGFPPVYHAYDHVSQFGVLHEQGRISDAHFAMVKRNQEIKAALRKSVDADAISSSGDFSDTSREALEAKIAFLSLEDYVVLVQGTFEDTMRAGRADGPAQICAASLDCDLYSSYEVALPFIWERAAPGALLYLDEYFSLKFPGARIAVDVFAAEHGVTPERLVTESDGFERWALRKPAV